MIDHACTKRFLSNKNTLQLQKIIACITRGNVSPGQLHCPRVSSSLSDHYEFILIPLVFTQIVTENEFYTRLHISGAFWNFLLEKFIPNIDNEHAQDYSCPGVTFAFCSHGEKLPRQGGLPGVVQIGPPECFAKYLKNGLADIQETL